MSATSASRAVSVRPATAYPANRSSSPGGCSRARPSSSSGRRSPWGTCGSRAPPELQLTTGWREPYRRALLVLIEGVPAQRHDHREDLIASILLLPSLLGLDFGVAVVDTRLEAGERGGINIFLGVVGFGFGI